MHVRLISITKPVIKLDEQMEMTPEGLAAAYLKPTHLYPFGNLRR